MPRRPELRDGGTTASSRFDTAGVDPPASALMADWIACHDCDLVHRAPDLPPGGAAKCSRCEAVLYRERHDGLNRALALTVAGLVLFAIAT